MGSSRLSVKPHTPSLKDGRTQTRVRNGRLVKHHREMLAAYGFLLPATLFYLGFQFLPIIGAFLLSLFQWNGINISDAAFVGLRNFIAAFQDPVFWSSLRNNIMVGVAVVILQCGSAFLLAAVIHAGITGAHIFRVVFFAPVVISSVALGMLAIFLFSPSIGLINDFLRSINLPGLAQPWLGSSFFALPSVIVTFIWQNIGFSLLLFLSALKQVPSEICEAALVDGASQRTILWSIILPVIRPVASVIVLLAVISAFRLFDTVYILTSGGPYHASDVLVTYLYESAFAGNQVGYGNAIGVILFIIIFVFALLQLHFTRAGESSF
jgi:raffinose/stachyose/melibiose transport system permease protein